MGFFRFKALGDRLKPKDKKPPEGGYLNSYCSIFPGVNAWARESALFKKIRLTTHRHSVAFKPLTSFPGGTPSRIRTRGPRTSIETTPSDVRKDFECTED